MEKIIVTACCLLAQSLPFLGLTKSEPVIVSTPTEIDVGLSDSLDVNCTFSLQHSSNTSALLSLSISRAHDLQQNFTDLANINQFSRDVNILTTETLTARSSFNSSGNSYLNLHWKYPDDVNAGVFKCVAQAFDLAGRHAVMTSVSEVTANQPSLDDWKVKVQELDKYTKNLKARVSLLENEKENRMLEMFEKKSLTYNNHKYYISKESYYDVDVAMATCKRWVGYLAEIDDVEEYHTLQAFLQSLRGIYHAVISGTDERQEGTWLLPLTNQPLPYIDWAPGNPAEGIVDNCIRISSHGC